MCVERNKHKSANHRWGTQKGSIILGTHHVAVERPRVRAKDGQEVGVKTYTDFQNPKQFERAVFAEGIKRVSQREYEKGVSKIASSFGFKKSQVSKRWVKATAKKIEDLQKRYLRQIVSRR